MTKKIKNNLGSKVHWSSDYADSVIKKFPDKDEYICAAGISPSGTIHFGNFRDVVTAYAVFQELKKRRKKAKMIFSWDDFDRFRKVPEGIDPSFEKYIGCPLSEVPAPDGSEKSYARYYEEEFEKTMEELDIKIEYRYQSNEYKSGRYDNQIIETLKKRTKIAKIFLSFMSEKGKKNRNIIDEEYINNYYPVTVYSRFSGKDNTKILDYDGDKKITYKCFDSGKSGIIDITKDRIVSLSWKVDWAMRWAKEGVNFEPGGKDHSSPGGSYDVSSIIAKEIFNIEPPIYQGYDFVGIRGLGDKMSGSKGNSVSPRKLLEIYSPELLKWLYFRTEPSKAFSLAFDSEVHRQYTEFDRKIEEINAVNNKLTNFDIYSLKISGALKKTEYKKAIPFRQAVGLGQIMQWDKKKVIKILKEQGKDYSHESIEVRLKKAKMWLETYNSDEIIKLREEKNLEYIKLLKEEDLRDVRKLKKELEKNKHKTISELNDLVYGVVKKEDLDIRENAKNQRVFFKIVYNLLIGRDAGPRLSTFLWAVEDKAKILKLLDI